MGPTAGKKTASQGCQKQQIGRNLLEPSDQETHRASSNRLGDCISVQSGKSISFKRLRIASSAVTTAESPVRTCACEGECLISYPCRKAVKRSRLHAVHIQPLNVGMDTVRSHTKARLCDDGTRHPPSSFPSGTANTKPRNILSPVPPVSV